jgi:hypothetical protein
MGNPRRLHGTIPAAFSATGQDVPPSPDVAAHSLAEVIGGAVAVHLAQLLAPVLQRLVDVQERYACIVCAVRVKVAGQEWKRDAAIRAMAAEPIPDKPEATIRQSFTDGARGPVCWECFDPDKDGIEPKKFRTLNDERAVHGLPPFEFPEANLPYLPPPAD